MMSTTSPKILYFTKASVLSNILKSCSLFVLIGLFSSCFSSSSKEISFKPVEMALLFPSSSTLPYKDSTQLNKAIQRWYDSVLKNRGFSGGLIVAKNGHILFEKYDGMANYTGTDAINENSPLHIASVSKTFTAMAVLKLWQDGKLDLDKELSFYFPSFNYPGVTIRTLLNHRSGLPNYTYFMENQGWNPLKFVSNQDLLGVLINKKAVLKDISKPNHRFSYCNTNYAILALLIEKVSGQNYSDYLKATFFEPLQMKNTYVFCLADTTKAIASYDWRGRKEKLTFLDQVYGDKNIYSTPKDLLIWDRALSSNLIFKPETLEQAYAPYSNERPGIRNYGLGWRMNNYPTGQKVIYHNGWWHGSNASFIRILADSVTIIAIGNKFNRNIYKVKDLSNLFGAYKSQIDEEESNTIIKDSSLKMLQPTSVSQQKKTSTSGSKN